MLKRFKDIQKVFLVPDRPDVLDMSDVDNALEATRNLYRQCWKKARIRRDKDSQILKQVHKPYKIETYTHDMVDDAFVLAMTVHRANTEATEPTVTGRICDLVPDYLVGAFISEILADLYDIEPAAEWMAPVDELF